jgi:hypothetical protein
MGKISQISSMSRSISARSERLQAPIFRFSSTVKSGKSLRPSGTLTTSVPTGFAARFIHVFCHDHKIPGRGRESQWAFAPTDQTSGVSAKKNGCFLAKSPSQGTADFFHVSCFIFQDFQLFLARPFAANRDPNPALRREEQ